MAGIPLKFAFREQIKKLILSDKKKIRHARINGYEMLVCVDEGVGWMIYYLKNFNQKETAYISKIAQPDWVCFDIGANVGYYSLLFSSRCPRGAVHAFEPIPLCYHLSSASIALNKFKNLTLNNCALSNKSGEAEFAVAQKGESSSFLPTDMSPLQEMIRVRTRTLDDYIREKGILRIDFMKIDVEGAEKLVFEGATGMFSSKELRPKMLLVELYDANFAPYHTSIDEIVGLLGSYGYQAMIIPKDRLVPFAREHHNIFYNVFFVKQ